MQESGCEGTELLRRKTRKAEEEEDSLKGEQAANWVANWRTWRRGWGKGRVGNCRQNLVGERSGGSLLPRAPPKDGEAARRRREERGRKGRTEQAKPRARLPQGRLTLSVLLLGVVGEGRGLHEGHQAMLAHEGPVPSVQPQVVLQRGVGRELGPALLTGEGLLIEVLRQLVVLHPWGGRQDSVVASV